MIKRFFVIVCINLFVFCSARAQLNIDSLLKAADAETTDSARLKIYNKVGNYYMDNNPGKAIEYLEKAKELALKVNNPLKAANNFYSIGYCYLQKAAFDKSLYNYQQSVKLYEKIKDTFRLSNALMSIGNVYFQNKNIANARLYYDDAEKIIKATNDVEQLVNIYDTKGTVYDQLGNFDSAVIYLQKAISLAKTMANKDFSYNSLSNLGLAYKHQFKTDEALKCFDSVLLYFNRSSQPEDKKAIVLNNIAATYTQAGNFNAAQTAFKQSLQLSKNAGIAAVEMENYRNMADMYGQMKNFELQAFFQQKYYGFKDSIFSVENKNKLTEQEAAYQVEKRNAEILKKDAEAVKQNSRQNVLMIIVLSILALLAALVFFYSRIKNKNRELQQKNMQISEQKDELQTLNHVKDRLFGIISHDLRNPMATLRSYLLLAHNETMPAEKKLQFKLQTIHAVSQTSDMLDNLLAWANVQLKNTKAVIVPVNIADIVQDEISNAAAQAFQKKITVVQDLQVDVLPGDYDTLSIALRNLLTNAIKFSRENSVVKIDLVRAGDKNLLSVKDNGVGLSAQQIQQIFISRNDNTKGTAGEKGSGLGLFLVRQLLEKMNAELLIESTPGHGSSFTISIPVL